MIKRANLRLFLWFTRSTVHHVFSICFRRRFIQSNGEIRINLHLQIVKFPKDFGHDLFFARIQSFHFL